MGNIYGMLQRAIIKGDLHHKMICWLLIQMGYSNHAICPVQIRYKVFRYLRRKYQNSIDLIYYEKEKSDITGEENVWICWLQGIENAPKIVHKCVDSIKLHMKGKKIYIITEDNFGTYIQLPRWLIEKWKNGIISNAHFSDVLRLELLIKYGGIWLDATVYLTGAMPQYMYERDLFAYSIINDVDITRTLENWFIVAKPNNRILKTIRDMLYVYWGKENKVREYFLWHLLATMTVEKYPEDYSEIYKITDKIPLLLQKNLSLSYDSQYMKILEQLTPIHKLTYKYDIEAEKGNTFLRHILES